MGTTRRIQFVHALTAWMLGAVLLLAVLDALSPEFLFTISLIGFFVIVDLTAAFSVTPRWRKRLWVVIGIGILGISYIVFRRTMEVLPEVM